MHNGIYCMPLFRNTVLASAIATSLASGWLSSVHAADTSNVAGTQSDDSSTPTAETALPVVQVTAQKRSESAQEVPQTLSVISGSTFQNDAAAGLNSSEITRFVPNASAATLDGHGFPRWFLRGIGTALPSLDNVSPIGFYVDEVYLGPIFLSGGPLYDIDRVEVLPGPQGTLWGKNSPGGAIHVVSRKPTFDDEGYIKAGLGSYGQKLLQGAVNGVLVEDKLATRLSFTSENRDQYVRNVARGVRGDLEDRSVRWQLLANLSDNLDALLSLHHREFTQDNNTSYITFAGAGAKDQYGNPYQQFPHRRYSFNAPTYSRHEQNGGVLTLNWDLDGYQFTSVSGVEQAQSRGPADGDGTATEVYRTYDQQKARQFSQEFRLASPRSDRLNWIAGAHYYYADLDGYSAEGALDIPSLYPGESPYYENNDWNEKVRSLGLFASTTYNFTDRFNLTTGIRWSEENKKIDVLNERALGDVGYNDSNHWWKSGAVNNSLTPYVNYSGDQTWREFTWDVTPEYRINDNLRAYLRVSKGFRGGGFISSPTSQEATGTYDPETILAYEVGLKSEWFNGRLNVNGSAFYYDYDDIQINVLRWDAALGKGVTRLQNAASASVKGAELQVQALPLDNLQVQFSLGLLDTKYKDYTALVNGVDVSYSGNSFARSPKVTAVLAAEYGFDLFQGRLFVGGDINTRSDFHFNSAAYKTNDAYLHAGYTLTNLHARYVFPGKQIELSAYVDNLTDKDYWQAAYPSGVTSAGYALGAPRTVGTAVQFNW